MKCTPWFGAVIGAVILGATPPAGVAAQHEKTPGELTVSRAWWADAKRGIEELEYHVAPVDGKDQARRLYQAPNRKHNVRTYFGDAGITLQDRTAANNPELVSFSFKGLGRGTSFHLVGGEPPEIRTEKNRVELRRQGITEWYVNRPDGLEQGFEILQRIPGEGELTLLLETRGAMLRVAGDKIVITSPTGRELEYGKLIILDGDGKAVPGRLEVKGTDRIVIAMDDTGARYPLSVDPLITSLFDAMLESDQADAWFGFSVAGAGDVNNDGYADVIVGAPNYDNGQTDEGAAFVYHGGAAGVATIAAAVLEKDQAGSSFGWSVAGAGDVNNDGYADVIVGAYLYDNGQTNEGSAFVYHGSYDGVVTTAARMLESDQAGAWSGYSVSGAGDVNDDGYADIIVGAYLYDNGQTDEGAAFVYHGSATGVASTFTARLESNQAGAWLGTSVGGAGDVNGDGFADVIVGAQHFSNGQTNEGAALVYHGSATGVALAAAVQLESNQAGAESGISVAGAGDVNNDGYADVIVGAYLYDSGQTDEGVAFVYYGSGTGVLTTPGATLEANQAGAWFGISVAGAGDVDGDGFADVIVGASNFSDGQDYEGAAFVYLGSIGGVATTADTQLESDQASAWYGVSVAGAGDVNNDGFADVIVGAFGFDNGQTGEGAAFIYHGTTTYTVTATAGANGSLDTGYMSSPQTVMHGGTASFKFDADAGYRMATISGCGISYSNSLDAITTYTATTGAVTGNCAVTATFAMVNNAPTLGAVTPAVRKSDPDVTQNLSAVYSDSNGYADIKQAYILINTTLSGRNGIQAFYRLSTGMIYLVNDTSTGWVSSCTPGTSGTLSNPQGAINCAATTVTGTGSDLTIVWNITPTNTFASPTNKNIYLYTLDNSGAFAGWSDKGDWTIFPDVAPTLGAVTPATLTSAPGVAQGIRAVYSDLNGYLDLRWAYILINTPLSGTGGIQAYYRLSTGMIYLVNDTSSGWISSCTPGTAGTLSNPQGTINCAATTVTGTGSELTINWNITPTSAFASTTKKNIYLYTADNSGAFAGWTDKGDWTVFSNVAPTLGTITPSVIISSPDETQSISTVYSDANGNTDLKQAYILINTTPSGTGSIQAFYRLSTGMIYLVNGTSTGWVSSCTPGAVGELSNPQGTINCAATTVTRAGNDLTIAWNITPTGAFASPTKKNIYLYTVDSSGAFAGWTDKGDWTIFSNVAPSLGTVTPSVISSPFSDVQSISVVYSDGNGFADIKLAYILINTPLSGTSSIQAFYRQTTGLIYLFDDTGTAMVGSCSPGVAGTLSNTQGALNCAATTVTKTGYDLTIAWNITPTSAFASLTKKNIYLYTADSSSAFAGWTDMGDWTITP